MAFSTVSPFAANAPSERAMAFDDVVMEAGLAMHAYALKYKHKACLTMAKFLNDHPAEELMRGIIADIPDDVKEFFGGGREMTPECWVDFARLGDLGDVDGECAPNGGNGNVVYQSLGVSGISNGRHAKYGGMSHVIHERCKQHRDVKRRRREAGKVWYEFIDAPGDVKEIFFTIVWRKPVRCLRVLTYFVEALFSYMLGNRSQNHTPKRLGEIFWCALVGGPEHDDGTDRGNKSCPLMEAKSDDPEFQELITREEWEQHQIERRHAYFEEIRAAYKADANSERGRIYANALEASRRVGLRKRTAIAADPTSEIALRNAKQQAAYKITKDEVRQTNIATLREAPESEVAQKFRAGLDKKNAKQAAKYNALPPAEKKAQNKWTNSTRTAYNDRIRLLRQTDPDHPDVRADDVKKNERSAKRRAEYIPTSNRPRNGPQKRQKRYRDAPAPRDPDVVRTNDDVVEDEET